MISKTKSLIIIALVVLANLSGWCQEKDADLRLLENKIIELDKAGWEAWKNKNPEWYQQNTSSDFISISSDGISDKAQVINATVNDCEIKSYALSEIKVTVINQTSVLLTYISIQDGTCKGVKLDAKVRVAASYIKQNEKWLEAFYMESKINP